MQPSTKQLERDIERTHRVLESLTDPLSIRTLRAYAAELESGLAAARRAENQSAH